MENTSLAELTFKIRLAKELDRFEDMKKYVQQYLLSDEVTSLDFKMRKNIAHAYKNCVSKRIKALRIVEAHEHKLYPEGIVPEVLQKFYTTGSQKQKENKKYDYQYMLKEFKSLKERELIEYVENTITYHIEPYLQKFTSNVEDRIFFAKMKGDNRRYVFDYCSCFDKATRKEMEEEIERLYQIAFKIGEENKVDEKSVVYLLLKLNYTVFLHSIGKVDEAISQTEHSISAISEVIPKSLKQKAFISFHITKDQKESEPNNVSHEVEENRREGMKDIIMTRNLLKENLALWNLQKKTGAANNDEEQFQPEKTVTTEGPQREMKRTFSIKDVSPDSKKKKFNLSFLKSSSALEELKLGSN